MISRLGPPQCPQPLYISNNARLLGIIRATTSKEERTMTNNSKEIEEAEKAAAEKKEA